MGGLVPGLRGRLRRGDSNSPTQWHSKGEHHQPGLEAAHGKLLCWLLLVSLKHGLCMGMLSGGQGSSAHCLSKEAARFLLSPLRKDQFSSR